MRKIDNSSVPLKYSGLKKLMKVPCDICGVGCCGWCGSGSGAFPWSLSSKSEDNNITSYALVNLLEDQPLDNMKVVAAYALQNLMMYIRTNKRTVAKVGGVRVTH
ncbi:hypothetical protein Tco_1101917 [Tanacetum coccineum]